MGHNARATLVSLAAALILVACGSNTSTSTTAAVTATSGTSSPTPTPTATAGVTEAELQSLADKLYPNSSSGRQTCFNGDTTVAQCPVTARLRTAIEAQQAQNTGGGADPICGCQNIDSGMSFTYTVDPSGGGGVIHMSSFGGSDRVDFVVIPQGGTFLADDIKYCSITPPSSVYPNETVSC
jgi:hypothetical protein